MNARRVAFYASLPYAFALMGTELVLPGPLGSIVRVSGLIALLLWIWVLVCERRLRRPHPYIVWFGLFIAWNGLTLLWSVAPDLTAERLYKYTLFLGMALMFWDLYRTRNDLRTACYAVILGGWLLVGLTIYNQVTGSNALVNRFNAGMISQNEQALVLSLCIPLAWHLASTEHRASLAKWIAFWFPAFAAYAILLTASRGGFIAMLVASLYILGSVHIAARRHPLAMALAASGFFLVFSRVDLSFQLDRVSSIGSSFSSDGFSDRIPLWDAAIHKVMASPLGGVGSGAFPASTVHDAGVLRGYVVHNTFLSLLVETGIVGFALFCILLLVLVRHVLRGRVGPWLWIILVWCFGVMSATYEHGNQTWLMFNLALCGAAIEIRAAAGTWKPVAMAQSRVSMQAKAFPTGQPMDQ